MDTLARLTKEYVHIRPENLSNLQLRSIREGLKSISKEEVRTQQDSIDFLTLLNHFRQAIADTDALLGDNYASLLESILSVGEDGLYSNSLRFIFELIQNVDDCDYVNPEDCNLEIHFRYSTEPGTIELTYNEVGFSPYNVFAITGIAEAAKNVQEGKVEIGEKGIGFKSVFGVADRVLIQSGLFSFELQKKNFTVPIPSYEDYKPVTGTRMVLFMTCEKVKEIYRRIADEYCTRDALFNRNPILFLNKLTRLHMYMDDFRNMDFSVTRRKHEACEWNVEQDVVIAAEVKDTYKGIDKSSSNRIHAIRFTAPVRYDTAACSSRYGSSTRVGGTQGKVMMIQAIVPAPEQAAEVDHGTLYSFLPTQVSLRIPAAIHVPFKLDASREFVDPQGRNAWFEHSCHELTTLLKRMYLELSGMVQEKIVWYLPSAIGSIFELNNEKVKCLSSREEFKGSTYLNLPIFRRCDGIMASADDIVCMNPEETNQPERAAALLGYSERLFVPPKDAPMKKLGVEMIVQINLKLVQRMFCSEDQTAEILEYLSEQGDFTFTRKDIDHIQSTRLTLAQVIQVYSHRAFRSAFLEYSAEVVRKSGKQSQFSVVTEGAKNLSDYMYEDFSLSDLPDRVRQYLNHIYCRFLYCEAKEESFFAAGNVLVLLGSSVTVSFAEFCSSIDSRNLFAANMKLSEASASLNKLDSTDMPADQYLQHLRLLRLSVKKVLGKTAYASYVNMILQSGSDAGRFINELLQNADDCEYPEDEIPSFTLQTENGHIYTAYNERGFTRANVRAITAIGESTKKRLLSDSRQTIGEKGVGFKNVFAAAKSVKIHSGEFCFMLSDDSPTIPEILGQEPVSGTRMDFELKRTMNILPDELSVLRLCMCLRKLKHLQLNGFEVLIEDTDSSRSIIINGNRHMFLRSDYSFPVHDPAAIQERQSGGREVTEIQHIYCYVPEEKEYDKDSYLLYSGLPTKITMNIPLYLDAPYILTLSRDHVVNGSNWNEAVTEACYTAVAMLVCSYRAKFRSGILRFLAFYNSGMQTVGSLFQPDIYGRSMINSNWVNQLRSLPFLPTYDPDVYAAPMSGCRRYPAVVNYLLRKGERISVPRSRILDVPVDRYEAILNVLGCPVSAYDDVMKETEPFVERYIQDDRFRESFYAYIKNAPETKEGRHRLRLQRMEIVPVYNRNVSGTEYISWSTGNIFTKKDAVRSTYSYYVLNEQIMSRPDCEAILGVHINEMNAAFEKARYREELQAKINTLKPEKLYARILTEFTSGALRRYDCMDLVEKQYREGKIYLRCANGRLVNETMFINTEPEGYFAGDLIGLITVHRECMDLAREIGCKPISGMHYDDIWCALNLSADDIETLQDDHFKYGAEILQGYINEGYVSEELIEQYHLGAFQETTAEEDDYDFPEEPIQNVQKLSQHIRTKWATVKRIESVEVTRREKRVMYNGAPCSIDAAELRRQTMQRYSPKEGMCFCQMCRCVKPYQYIEVNNIESNPKYFWPELRVALCLECSKRFEGFRGSAYYQRFLDDLRDADLSGDEPLEVPYAAETISFTQTHLAEIQEILKGRTQ